MSIVHSPTIALGGEHWSRLGASVPRRFVKVAGRCDVSHLVLAMLLVDRPPRAPQLKVTA